MQFVGGILKIVCSFHLNKIRKLVNFSIFVEHKKDLKNVMKNEKNIQRFILFKRKKPKTGKMGSNEGAAMSYSTHNPMQQNLKLM